MFRRLTLLAGGAILLAALPVQARNSPLGELYGRGIQAYFSRDFVKAHELLTAAIDGESSDPRAYYFRGLVCLRLNRSEEARMDFEKGAKLEAGDLNVFYDVSKALERIQGKSRLAIEKYRGKARLNAMKRTKAIRHARYEAIRGQEDRVLRRNVVLTPESMVEENSAVAKAEPTVPDKGPAVGEQPEENPFAEIPASVPDAAETTPKQPGKLFGAFGKAFGEVVGKQAQGVAGTVGGALPGGPKPGPATAQPGTGDVDPFGDDDPFGGASTPEVKAPAKTTEAGGEDDPFADKPLPKTPPAAPGVKAPTKPSGTGAEGIGFGGLPAPATEAPGKAAGQTPVTKPGLDVGRPKGATALKLGEPSKAAKPAKKATKQIPTTTLQPAGDNPFVEEAAPAKKAPAKKTPAKKDEKADDPFAE